MAEEAEGDLTGEWIAKIVEVDSETRQTRTEEGPVRVSGHAVNPTSGELWVQPSGEDSPQIDVHLTLTPDPDTLLGSFAAAAASEIPRRVLMIRLSNEMLLGLVEPSDAAAMAIFSLRRVAKQPITTT